MKLVGRDRSEPDWHLARRKITAGVIAQKGERIEVRGCSGTADCKPETLTLPSPLRRERRTRLRAKIAGNETRNRSFEWRNRFDNHPGNRNSRRLRNLRPVI